MGPGDGIQIQRLMDLPTTLETAEPGERGPSVAVEMRDSRSLSQTKHTSLNQSTSSGISLASQQINQQGVQRVKSLLQTSLDFISGHLECVLKEYDFSNF